MIGVRSIAPCAPDAAERHSGYLVGGTSPFGTKKPLPVYLEETILELPKIYINGGKRGFLVGLDPQELVQGAEAGSGAGRDLAVRSREVRWRWHGTLPKTCRKAADAIRNAEALVITAGAGMGVDSGLPDFRGDRGFLERLPHVRAARPHFRRGRQPRAISNAIPAFGWGFYGHRTNLYRETVPHAGFSLLREWIERFGLDCLRRHLQRRRPVPEGRLRRGDRSSRCTARSTICSASAPAPRRSGTTTRRSRSISPPCAPGTSRAASTAAPSPAPTSSCSATGRGSPTAPRARRALRRVSRQTSWRSRSWSSRWGPAPPFRPSATRASSSAGAASHGHPHQPPRSQIGAPHLSLPCGALEGLRGIERLPVVSSASP